MLGAAVGDDRVLEAELRRDVAQEMDALRAALDERELAPGLRDRERNPREPSARPDVCDALALEQRAERKTLDEVPIDDVAEVAQAREVVDAIPAHEQLDETRERRALGLRQRNAGALEPARDFGGGGRRFGARHVVSMPRARETCARPGNP